MLQALASLMHPQQEMMLPTKMEHQLVLPPLPCPCLKVHLSRVGTSSRMSKARQPEGGPIPTEQFTSHPRPEALLRVMLYQVPDAFVCVRKTLCCPCKVGGSDMKVAL